MDAPLSPSAQVVVALAAHVRFAGYARLYAVLVFLVPGLLLLATPMESTATRTFHPIGESIIEGRSGTGLVVVLLALYVAVLVTGAFNPVRAVVGSLTAFGGLVLTVVMAGTGATSEDRLAAGGWGMLLVGVACLVLGVTHEWHLARARRAGLGV